MTYSYPPLTVFKTKIGVSVLRFSTQTCQDQFESYQVNFPFFSSFIFCLPHPADTKLGMRKIPRKRGNLTHPGQSGLA